jgi:hypothetical protein
VIAVATPFEDVASALRLLPLPHSVLAEIGVRLCSVREVTCAAVSF